MVMSDFLDLHPSCGMMFFSHLYVYSVKCSNIVAHSDKFIYGCSIRVILKRIEDG